MQQVLKILHQVLLFSPVHSFYSPTTHCAVTLGQWPYKHSWTGLLPDAAGKRVTLQLLRQAAYFHLM